MKETGKNNLSSSILFFLGLVFLFTLLRTAWITEDAYITLRTVDNFINGYGLTWNIAERVQAYTHPLWMFLLAGLYAFTRESFYTTLALSVFASSVAFALVIKAAPRHNLASYAGISVLIFSKAFIDYSTSGLENPLTHLLLAAFLILFLSDKFLDDSRIFWLSLLAGLAATNRVDSILFFAPALALILFQRHDRYALRQVFLGLLPFLLWEIFSLFYYGFPFPNTAYAKLNTGLLRADLLEQGYLYFLNSIHWDPLTLLVIAFSLGLVTLQGTVREKAMAIGASLYLFYIFWIGGDYMSGRFFSAALLMAVVIMNHRLADLPLAESAALFILIALLGLTSPTPTLTSIDDASYSTARVDVNGIADERSYYFQPSGLIYDQKDLMEPYHDWVFKGQALRANAKKVVELYNVGFMGYYAGPQVYIIDRLALADPLLAHLKPISTPTRDRLAGHFERNIPDGYFESVKNNENRIVDPALKEYYDKIRILTRAPLWSWERLQTIWQMNTGQLSLLLESYQSKQNAP